MLFFPILVFGVDINKGVGAANIGKKDYSSKPAGVPRL